MSVAFSGEPYPHTDETEDSRIKTALEQGVLNPFMAEASEVGAWPHDEAVRESDAEVAPKTIPTQRQRLKFPEAAAADREPPKLEHLTEQQQAERQAVLTGEGHRAAVVAAEHVARSVITRKAAGSFALEAALLRAYAERHNRTV